jgi:hypothetical protein
MTGTALAARVGVSQPRASQVMHELTQRAAVAATADGYVGRPATLLDLYGRRARPALVGPESYWYSTRPVFEQAARIVRHAESTITPIAFSADLAPDLLVPWRHPTLTIVYADGAIDLNSAGFVPAEGRSDASVIVRRTQDRTLLAAEPPWPVIVEGIPLTDPTQQWWDLIDLGGEDRLEAAGRLRTAIIARTIPGSE